MRIGFTGTRQGMSGWQMAQLDQLLSDKDELHHGDAIGADSEAHAIAQKKGCAIVIHPCTVDNQRAFSKGGTVLAAKHPLVRNRDIVNATDLLIAAPLTDKEELRSGTWATVRYAVAQDKDVIQLER